MNTVKTLADWMREQELDVATLADRSRLDKKVVEAIVADRYTTSPKQRQRICAALGVAEEDVRWSAAVGVDHMYGHGPQFGRSP